MWWLNACVYVFMQCTMACSELHIFAVRLFLEDQDLQACVCSSFSHNSTNLPYTLIREHAPTPQAFTEASITSPACASSPSPAMVLPQLPLPKDS